MASLRVLIADDHAMVREGLVMLIQAQADMEVVGQAADGREAVRLAGELHPDVAVLDVSMPHLPGPEAAEAIRDCCPHTRVIALTRHTEHAYVRRLLQAGAAGYVLKKSAADVLIRAIRTVAAGESYIEPALAGALLQTLFAHGPVPRQSGTGLTVREEEVLRAIAWGRSNKEIAGELGLSVKTVESYKAAAAEKLQLRNRKDIVRYALSQGWLSDESAPE